MKLAICVLTIAVCLIGCSDAFWGYSGFGRWGGLGYGLGDGVSNWGMGGWGWSGYKWYRSTISMGDIESRTQCQYIVNKSMLICKGPNSVIECEATAQFMPEMSFELYGLRVTPGQEHKDFTETCFQLYPRSLDNTVWYNHSMLMGDSWMSATLSFIDEKVKVHPHGCGIAVHELPCWRNLVEFFKTCNSTEVISVEPWTNGSVVEKLQEVSLFGEIVLME